MKQSYYKVGRIPFESKVEACVFSEKVNKPVEWVYDAKAVFDNYDWTVEPSYSLDFYYDKRAREIREKYDYVAIAYSGGSDSHNVLMSFIRQNLHVDELLVSHISDLSDKRSESIIDFKDPSNIVAEHRLNVVPKLQRLRSILPNTKFTVTDMSGRVLNFITTKHDEGWIYDRKDINSIWNVTRDWFSIDDFKRTLERGRSVAIVIGLEKPKLMIDNGVVYTLFSDTTLYMGTPDNFKYEYSNAVAEYFYWDKTSVDMLCKQAHAIKQQLEVNTNLRRLWDWQQIGDKYNDISKVYHEPMIIPWIYTTWDNGFQAAKAKGGAWDSEYDSIWWKDSVDSKQIEIFNKGMSMLEDIARYHIIYKDGVPQRLRPFVIQYKIGNITQQQ
jgi:hypothetical protein